MKKVLIVTMGDSTGESFYKQLNSLMGHHIEFSRVTLDNLKGDEICDLIIFSTDYVHRLAADKTKLQKPHIVVKRVVDHKNLLRILHIKEGAEVLLVNDLEPSATETIYRLLEIGLDHVNYTAFFPGCGISNFDKYDVAVTPGEPHLVPREIKEWVDIGTRIISIGSIYEMTVKLDFDSEVVSNLTGRYVHDIVNIMKEIESNRLKLFESELYVSKSLDSLSIGIIGLNKDGTVERLNNMMERVLSKAAKDIKGNSISDIIPNLSYDIEENDNKSIMHLGKRYLCQVNTFLIRNETKYILTFEFVDDVRSKDVRIKSLDQQEIQLHTFDDYQTIDQKNLKMLDQAKRFSLSDAQILIEGENGTGKEILAQAIHSHSRRKMHVFMPINITAISENLLESELFGYEPGAFTGADKNGKIGIFEQAEGGTVFIDEVGDAPLSIQARLLRVIQEKKIRRVGGLMETPIDVRIIAATNKNLKRMVKEGTFRQDLFYRLNVLPIRTIPLRNRKADIEFLLDQFVKSRIQSNINDLLDVFMTSTMEFLRSYNWPGNVRELLNLAEFISYSYTGNRMSVDELPYYFLEEDHQTSDVKLDYFQYKILQVVESEKTIGRRVIADRMSQIDSTYTEGKIRTMLKKLIENELLIINGKRGVSLSDQGKMILDKYNQLNLWE